MSTLYLGHDLEQLAAELDRRLRDPAADLTPTAIVVPNRCVQQWLKLHLARSQGVVANIRWLRLETALWEWFREVDPRQHDAPPEMLDGDRYQFLVLATLLDDDSPALAPLRNFLQRESTSTLGRAGCRRAWRLAVTLGTLIRDYEYHRQFDLIQPWLQDKLANLAPDSRELEAAQQAIFHSIVAEPDGRRARLNRATGRNFKTLPQYVMEVMELPELRQPESRTMHLFGLGQISALHARALQWLAPRYDLRVYALTPFAPRLERTLSEKPGFLLDVAQRFAPMGSASDVGLNPSEVLLRAWGRAGAESLYALGDLLKNDAFAVQEVGRAGVRERPGAHAPRLAAPSVLTTLQSTLLTEEPRGLTPRPPAPENSAPLPQDRSLQIVGCPGIFREVETVHNSIIQNLLDDKTLRLADIAVLATDMARYRPAVQAVFDRPPRAIPFNLVDYAAAGVSAFGQALLGMLDLALDGFSRSRVLEVLQNPCFLAKLGVALDDTHDWLRWTDALGVHEGWDAREKADAGLPATSLFGWRQALRRLRLGRCMETVGDDHAGPAPRFGDTIPFADTAAGDPDKLAVFCDAVEGLLPALVPLRRFQGAGKAWADTLRGLVHDFLLVPPDRPEEAAVRDDLLDSFEALTPWDGVAKSLLPLSLVREFVASRLEALEGRRGDYLVGGVTVAALQPMRPIPFRIIYVLGLNEDAFPGSNRLGSLDLRQHERRPGDIRPAEQQRYAFLETILAARDKLYLLFNNWDVQRDQRLLPAVPVQQLRRHLKERVVGEEFQIVPVPLRAGDGAYFDPTGRRPFEDMVVQHHPAERAAALLEAERGEFITFGDSSKPAETLRRKLQPDFRIRATRPPAEATMPTLSLSTLRDFLYSPAKANLKRHLRLDDDRAPEPDDFEPLVTPPLQASALVRQVLTDLAVRAGSGHLRAALADWPKHFQERCADQRQRCHLPEGAFGDVDQEALHARLHEHIHGENGLETFLKARTSQVFCGPILLGESITPVGARLHLPALSLESPNVRLVGSFPLAWHDVAFLDLLAFDSKPEDKDAGHLRYVHLKPLLFYLMLLANAAPNRDGCSGRDLASKKTVRIHVAQRGSMETLELPPGLITAEEAVEYLSQVAADCLDPTCFDPLPFYVVSAGKRREAFEADMPRRSLALAFKDMVEGELENGHNGFNDDGPVAEVLSALALPVPADAFERVRRRFHLLDRPLAALRAMKAESKTKAPRTLRKARPAKPRAARSKRGVK